MIICLYIEVKDIHDMVKLEHLIRFNGNELYNASDFDMYCNETLSLKDIERTIEGK